MRIVCISDTHCKHDRIKLPEGDVLVHAGDATNQGTFEEWKGFVRWFEERPFRHKIFVAGNHDWCLYRETPLNGRHGQEVGIPTTERQAAEGLFLIYGGLHYLRDQSIAIDGVKFYGSPWQPEFCNWAFNLPRGEPLRKIWGLIPNDTNVLITHGPQWRVLDSCPNGDLAGCVDLRKRVDRLVELGHLKLHVCGHIHHSYGQTTCMGRVRFVNAAICDERYAPTNKPIVIDV